jgi:hypothetical protein
MNDIPIIGAKPEQPTFPQMIVNVNPQGLQITVVHIPGYSSTFAIGPDLLDGITKQWKEEKQKGIALMRAVEQSRNN